MSLNLPFVVLITAVIMGLLFHFIPSIDIAISALFYTPGHGFELKHSLPLRLIYVLVMLCTITLITSGLVLLILSRHRAPQRILSRPRDILYLLLVLALGPGLMVNEVLKEHSGRARPALTEVFGGTQPFTAAFSPSNACEKNCSFVSGHAAVGFYFFALAFIFPRKRLYFTLLGAGLGSIFGIARIAQGGHYASDVVFSGYVVWFTCWALAHVMLREGDIETDGDTAANSSMAQV